MRPGDTILGVGQESFPRVSGDAPWAGVKTAHVLLFSPRERGCAAVSAAADLEQSFSPRERGCAL